MNSVILIGRLARDPELSYTPNTQTAACRITLAVDRPKRNGDAQGEGDYVRSADFIRVTVWGRQAETCDRYLAKGRQVAVQGRIQTGSYKNRNGETVYTTDVVAERVEFLGGGNQQQVNKDTNKPCNTCYYGNYSDNLGWCCSNQRTCDASANLYKPIQQPQQNTPVPTLEPQQTTFDDLPDTFQATDDDIPF